MQSELQSANSVLLVRPAAFGFHADAAQSNAFASRPDNPEVTLQAVREFEGLGDALERARVNVIVLADSPEPNKPDAVFPNNWVSFHTDGTMVLYPMATAARRLERDTNALTALLQSAGFALRHAVDLSAYENEGRFLEGTGSLILDRPRRRAYASVSARTHREVIAEFDRRLNYSTFIFDARDRADLPIYHTNVLMSLGTDFAVLCTDAVRAGHRQPLLAEMHDSGRDLIEVDYDQMCGFACNILELSGRSGEPVIAMSSAARGSFRPEQLRRLERHGVIVEAAIPTIEAVGGGSVRCMIAEIHLPRI